MGQRRSEQFVFVKNYFEAKTSFWASPIHLIFGLVYFWCRNVIQERERQREISEFERERELM